MSRTTLVVLLAIAACDQPRELHPLGGPWYLEEVKVVVFGGHSPVPHQELRRKDGEDYHDLGRISRARLYPPDCLAWTGRGGWFFACGNHQPVPAPSWVLTAGPEGLIGGYITRGGVESWELLPLDAVRRAALRAPPFDATAPELIQPVPLPKVWVNYQPVADAIDPSRLRRSR
jgi:hypothetical protein